jgi:hypothetical protein
MGFLQEKWEDKKKIDIFLHKSSMSYYLIFTYEKNSPPFPLFVLISHLLKDDGI